jgi:hypothetical protein
MGIRYFKKYASLEGVISVDDAQSLLDWLKSQPEPAVKLGKCQHVHAAVLQVLLALHPKVIGDIGDPWLAGVLGCAAMQAKAA